MLVPTLRMVSISNQHVVSGFGPYASLVLHTVTKRLSLVVGILFWEEFPNAENQDKACILTLQVKQKSVVYVVSVATNVVSVR